MTPDQQFEKEFKPIEEAQLAKRYIALIALIQGLLLAFVYTRVEAQLWPATSLSTLYAIIVFVLSYPALFILISSKHDYKKVALYLLLFCIVLASLAAYVGSLIIANRVGNLLFIFTLCGIVASFKAALYIKSFANKTEMTYARLFTQSWRNFVLGAETALFCGIFFAILFLGAKLFSVLGIQLFEELLENQWFWVPALTLSASLAINVFRNIIHTVDTAATILQTLMKFLLPLLVIVSLGFISTLPFTGLEKLWETGSGTGLVLCLQALSLFFVNAVYHEGSDKRPYNVYLHRAIIIGVAVLPIYSIIAAHGLWLRIDQYGFTVERCWALVIWFVFAMFSLSYFIGIIKLRDNWLLAQSKINVAMGLFVLIFSLIVQSPILNFHSISASSQLARIDDGKVSLEDFDFDYFVYQLHKPGKQALEEFKLTIADEHPEVLALIDRKYAERLEPTLKHRLPADVIRYWPSQDDVPPELISELKKDSIIRDIYTDPKDEVHIVKIDANEDGLAEYLILRRARWSSFSTMYYSESDVWKSKVIYSRVPEDVDITQLLESHEVELTPSKWQNIKIGEVLIETNN
ncbi:DUF4153 domain-containing protein [Glaciecola sp. MF2-115]|uniref:DUF4153 domain-containing protein n=1 Tax=Glaciecola sp. MF2-115 TaxID=3384827 RepID=UPI0039A04A71